MQKDKDAFERENRGWKTSGQAEGHPKGDTESAQRSLKVLVIEDEAYIVELIRLGLRYEGFQVESTADGLEGFSTAQKINPDMVILDLGLPLSSIDGLEVCRRLRANPTTQDVPILMLTAKDDMQDKVAGLEAGADDYLAKPFGFEELVARIRAILRRQRRSSHGDSPDGNGADTTQRILEFGDLRLNMATREVTRGSKPIDLTVTEYKLLHLFMSHPRIVLDRPTILNCVWGYDFLGETNIIEVYVRYLREKIEDSPSTPRLIQTIRGVGYILKG